MRERTFIFFLSSLFFFLDSWRNNCLLTLSYFMRYIQMNLFFFVFLTFCSYHYWHFQNYLFPACLSYIETSIITSVSCQLDISWLNLGLFVMCVFIDYDYDYYGYGDYRGGYSDPYYDDYYRYEDYYFDYAPPPPPARGRGRQPQPVGRLF